MFFIWIFDRYFAIMFKHSQLIQGSVGSWVWSAPIGRVPEMWDYAGSWLQLSPGFCNTPVYSGGSSWPWSQRELILGLLAITGNCGEDSFTCLPNPISFDCGAVSQGVLVVKNLAASGGDVRHLGSIPESERSPGEGNGNPLQFCCLENPMDWRKEKGHCGLGFLSLSPLLPTPLSIPFGLGIHREGKGREEDRLNLKPEFCFQAATKVML